MDSFPNESSLIVQHNHSYMHIIKCHINISLNVIQLQKIMSVCLVVTACYSVDSAHLFKAKKPVILSLLFLVLFCWQSIEVGIIREMQSPLLRTPLVHKAT